MPNNFSSYPPTVIKLIFSLFILTFSSCNEAKNTPAKIVEDKKEIIRFKKMAKTNVILCFGNSLTEGYGLDSEDAYPNKIQNKIDSLGYDYEVVNAGLSGETTSGGLGRLDWVLKQNVKLFILELGANDGLRGIPLTETKKNLQAIIDAVKLKLPQAKIVLAGMQIPPNLGGVYTSQFKNIFPELAKKNNVYLIPFLLKGVAGISLLNQKDGIHPTAEAQYILVRNIWEIISPLLEK